MPLKKHWRVVVVAAMTLGPALDAAAQSGPGRPYRAVFGGATTDPSMHQSLDVTLSLAEAYDDNVLGDGSGGGFGPTSPLQVTGMYTVMAPTVSYNWTGRHASFNSSVGSNFRYYGKQGEFIGTSHFGAVGFSSRIGSGQLAATQTVSSSPSYFYGLLPSLSPVGSAVPVSGTDNAIDEHNALFSDSTVNFNQELSSRSRVSLLGSYRAATFPDQSATQDLRSYGIGGRYGYDLTKNATLHFGYVYRGGQYSEALAEAPTVVHDIDAGVDYHRPLSLTRRTRVDFSVGSTIVSSPESQSSDTTRQFRVVGTAALSHDMGRTWRARLSYNRGAGFAGGFNQPVFADAAIASLEGFFSRRLDFHTQGGFSYGSVGRSSIAQNGFRTYTATARLRAALNPVLAVFGEYFYYKYELGADVATVTGVPLNLDRNSVRLGLTVWLPLVRR
jgi:hypothetical protein